MQIADNEAWVALNFGEVDLGDMRLTKRLQVLASNALKTPHGSIVAQNVTWAATKAAYRFYDNEKVTFEKVVRQHWEQTRQTQPGRYLLISDTTEIDHTDHKATTGLGILGNGKGRGMQLHSCVAYSTTENQIVGIAGALIHHRKRVPKGETDKERLDRLRESHVWGTLTDQVGTAPDGSQWTHVWDRGGDDFESMCHVKLNKNDFIIRASRLNRKVIAENGITMELKKAVEGARVLGTYDVEVRNRKNEPARIAKMELAVTKVTFLRPTQSSSWVKRCGIEEITVYVTIAREVEPPQGSTRVQWVLLTTHRVETRDEAMGIVNDYEKRWLIEEFHKVTKSGCSIELHALEKAERLEPQIGLLSVVGIRILQLKLIGRNQPKAKAKTHVPSDWMRAMQLIRPTVNFDAMTVYQFLREIAKLGGFLARKGDGEPGWITIWRGMEKLLCLLDGIRLGLTEKQN